MSKTLHFTLGPVQSFVEQARRTRDLWAGSFLLSYLSGHAMKAVIDAGGKIAFPAVTDEHGNVQDDLLQAILSLPHNSPEIGSLPNRFKASVPDDFEPECCQNVIQTKWQAIAAEVWKAYVEPIAELGHNTQQIWDEQVANFWDTVWVIDQGPEDKSDSTWLDQRKNWRTYHPPAQCGDHCTLMGDWSELSGYIRAHQQTEQDAFWNKLRQKTNDFNLGENERLCAIALIKRLYPQIAGQIIGWDLEVKHWPSTPYMAAVPWLFKVYEKDNQACLKYAEFIDQNLGKKVFTERSTQLEGTQKLEKFSQLDGNFYYINALENKKATPLKQLEDGSDDVEFRQQIIEELQTLQKAVSKPSPFYALLLMDGDHLGKLLREIGETEVSKSLSEFTERVDATIKQCCGKTVYAGGDDVLALLPLDQAIEAACQLRQDYRQAFQQQKEATISAAIIFAHYNTSLRAVLKEAHHQLDDIAKDENGRDSLAIAVMAGSGCTIKWVSTWQDGSDEELIPKQFELLRQRFSDRQFSSKFVYNIRQRLDPLLDDQKRLIQGLDPQKLLLAEYTKNREDPAGSDDSVDKIIKPLLKICRRRKRKPIKADERSLIVDGALLVRFLAHQEVEDV